MTGGSTTIIPEVPLLRLQQALIARLVLRVNWWRVLEEVEVSSVARDDSKRLYVRDEKRGGTWGAFKNIDIVNQVKLRA